jgi:glutamyl-tRNA synthetase
VGGVRTALYSWLYARHHGGDYVLRIEDTDRERSTEAAVRAILDGLAWVGLNADEGPVYQTHRFDRYREVADSLLRAGSAYHCYCTREELDAMRAAALARGEKPRYDGRCRSGAPARSGVPPVVRFKNPLDGDVVLDDLVKGRIVFANKELDDLVILRSDGTPTYNFTVVVDDADMQISHVIRGDDHVNNTPRQLNMLRALGVEPPAYAHLPMINGSDGAKLSKRHGAVSVLEYQQLGILPDALLNYLLRLGWSHGDQEIFSREEMVGAFDLDAVNRSSASFDTAKLLWVNHQHMLKTPREALASLLGARLEQLRLSPASGPPLAMTVDALRERSQTIVEMAERARCYYSDFDAFDEAAAKAHLRPPARPFLAAARDELQTVDEWTETATQEAMQRVAAGLGVGLGKIAQPLRVALTGQAASPGIGTTLVLVGRARTVARIDRALAYIDAAAGDRSVG